MHLYIFNAALFAGWLLVLAGGVLLNPGAGLAAAGVLLILLVLLCVKLANGLYMPGPLLPKDKAR